MNQRKLLSKIFKINQGYGRFGGKPLYWGLWQREKEKKKRKKKDTDGFFHLTFPYS